MPKEDFQGIGGQHQASGGVRYPAQISEDDDQLIDHPIDNRVSYPDLEKAGKSEAINRAMSHGQRSNKDEAPWHALVEVKEPASKKHAS